ncbi:MAG: sodium-translocating pyrophosphatase [Chloroflexia bacterium]|nr:sodium-translocating pyrophosphatase [Chloroflexia bacterium]
MDNESLYAVIIFGSGIIGILFALGMARYVLSKDTGTPEMKDIADTIYEGAVAYLNRQYLTIGAIALVTAVVIGVLISAVGLGEDVDIDAFGAGWRTSLAFLAGALASGISGYIGMIVAVRSNVRTAAAARRSLGEALLVALRGGAVSGFLIVALSIMGVAGIFYAYDGANDPATASRLIVGFGFGASFVALFAQLGGGIYTKAADVGADLVGKIEAGIPEDDPRNAAVIADLVGDNVGDCAGRGADLFESTAAENIGAMILGAAIFSALPAATSNSSYILFSLVIGAIGLLASIIGILSVRPGENPNPLAAMNRGFAVTALLSVVGLAFGVGWMLDGEWWLFLAGLVGIVTAILFLIITQYYTATNYRPVRNIAEASRTGPATNIITGLSIGFENTAIPAIVISLALGASYYAGQQAALTADEFINGVYGTAVATMGMLMSAGYVLAMDVFGPITDNAGGVVEMSNQSDEVRARTDALDSVGNTTKALTKGYAIGSAALAAFLLFSAYLAEANLQSVDLSKIHVFVGGFLGAMLVFLFSSLAIRAVGRAAGDMIEEVRRQFRSDPGILAGTVRPDYARAVDISTRAALREMILPGALAVTMPVVVGLVLRAEAVAAFLIVGTMTGILLALVMNNGGGAWDNAKKLIESGEMHDADGKVLGKGSDLHAAAVVGDTVGDPFKDTAGPSLHVLIKLLATVTLVLAPLFT